MIQDAATTDTPHPVLGDLVPLPRASWVPVVDEQCVADLDFNVVLVHDYLTQRGGAERVALEMTRQFPGAPLLTTFYEPSATYAEFEDVDVRPAALSRVKPFRRDPRLAFLLLAGMFSARRTPAGVVLVSSSGWAHGIRTANPKVVYCHNPARWLYQPDDYFAELPRVARQALSLLLSPLRAWDRRAARTVTTYLANSTAVAHRIKQAYGIEATVVHPPSCLRPDGTRQPIEGIEPGYLLTVGRRRAYKNTELICDAAARSGRRLVVVGALPDRPEGWPPHITGVTNISDAELRWLYANCEAVVAMSREDFGLTPIEGFSFGKPCIALRAGGFLDSCIDGVTSVFVDEADCRQLAAAMRDFTAQDFTSAVIISHAAKFTPAAFGHQLRVALAAAIAREGAIPVDAAGPVDLVA